MLFLNANMSAAQEMMPDQSKDHYRQFPVDYPKHTTYQERERNGDEIQENNYNTNL
jgi:hypothetical protein